MEINLHKPTSSTKEDLLKELPKEFIDTEFQVPTMEVELPSMGLFYGGKKSVKIKFLTAEEDDILFSPELIRSGKSLDTLLQHAVVDQDLNPDDMLVGDRNMVLVALRRTGLGDSYTSSERICPSCNESFVPEVDLSLLKMKQLVDQPDSRGEYAYVMPTSNYGIKFRFLTGRDENRLAKSVQAGNKKVGQLKVAKTVTEKYLLHIMEVDGERDKLVIQKFISSMPMRDSAAFREYIRLMEPNIDHAYTFECPHCSHQFVDDVELDYKLFYPSMKK